MTMLRVKILILILMAIAMLIFAVACSGNTSSNDNVLGKWQACGWVDDGEKNYYEDYFNTDEMTPYTVEFKGEHDAIYMIGDKKVDVECEKVSDDEYILQVHIVDDEFIEISYTYDGEHLIAYCEAGEESMTIYERVE